MRIKRTLRFNTPLWIAAGVIAGVALAVDGIYVVAWQGEIPLWFRIGGALRIIMGIVLAAHCLVRLSMKRRFERLMRRRELAVSD